MEPKEYQVRALQCIGTYLRLLYDWKQKNEQVISTVGPIDFPGKAWHQMEGLHRPYSPRWDGLGRYLPCFCLKIPTGGGKTFLAVKTIDLINTNYLKRRTGLVLWVVPTTQIYNQTIKSLRDRDHPYRQHLDIASGGRTVIREKGDHFTPQDVRESLVVLMLMLPSANRKTKEQLRVFKDSGGFADFFPPEDDARASAELIERIPNLDTFESQNAFWGRQIKTSLGNTLRLLNPILILDEGQKAYSKMAQETLNGFNPSIIVELPATPPEGSSVLVDVTGIELNREEMIKLDMHVFNKASPNWHDTLLDSHNKLQELRIKAREYEAQTGNHIRPICLIQVERTGAAQRGQGKIHSEDVREHLLKVIGVEPEEVAVKTSEKDELKEVDDIGGLMSKDCRIRYIITKQALQEGWDCAFAYVLAVLTNPGSKTALTQLVGRILRQPYARKTGIKELDESYVYCFQQRGNELLNEIRQGFKGEGLGDLNGRVAVEEEVGSRGQERVPQIREKFAAAADQVILPVFVTRDGAAWRKVSYEMDIESRIRWDEADLAPLHDLTLSVIEEKDMEHVGGVSDDPSRAFDYKGSVSLRTGVLQLDPVFVARHLLDVVPNPWVAHEFGQRALQGLLERNDRKLVMNNFVFIIEELHKHLLKERDRLSQVVFKEMLSDDTLRFLVIANDLGWKIPRKKKGTRPPWLPKETGLPLERSLFDPVPNDLNEMEKRVAWYLDDQDKLLFWYRNIPKQDYAVQGWRRGKVYADFIFTDVDEAGSGFNRVFVVETKGMQLEGSRDTDYKRALFDMCSELAREMTATQLGLKLHAKEVFFAVINEEEWERRFNELFV
jgi:type III restriction enzyme